MKSLVIQVNLQSQFGGGEVYTAFLCRALSQLGIATRLFVHPRANFWHRLPLPSDTTLHPVKDFDAVAEALPTGEQVWLISHGPLPSSLTDRARRHGHLVTAIAHMPVQGRNPAAFAGHDRVFAVSGWVLDGLDKAGLPAWHTPLYGVADLARTGSAGQICRCSRYDWDRRKVRDRILSWGEPLVESLRSHPPYTRRPGITLGVVSRLTPIKQFPQLFAILAPVMARTEGVNLEIFGSGGYASVRDLTRALAPIASRVRFWGHQRDIVSVYRNIDYLMTGLPEKEALGLNVIEAQTCGTPVLAPAAPPFTETVAGEGLGFLYCDPRQDAGNDFTRMLGEIQRLPQRPDPRQARDHLAKFSFDAFVERLRSVVAWAAGATS